MTPSTLPFSVSALHEILDWSSDRPDWQRDALRRIVTNNALSDGDLDEMDRLCRAKYGADKSNEPAIKAQLLAAAHLPPAPGAAASVTLISISDLQRVNRLPSDQVLSFGGAPGLTVIYGDNGAGKSGYARVIKKACRTRGTPPPIKPNAFGPAPKDPATAAIKCSVAGGEQVVTWKDGEASDPCLANVFAFDSSTAGHYLQEDGPAVFTPHGLDVLQKLSKACDAISTRIQTDINNLNAQIAATASNWKSPVTTKVGALLKSLSATTSTADVDALAVFVDQDRKRLAELAEALKADPKQKAKETRASAARLRAFNAKVAVSAAGLADAQIVALRSLMDEAKSAAAAAQTFAAGQFDTTYLPGTGGAVWRSLFEAAREFSVSAAYKDQDFPVLTEAAKCVLCQQDIGEKATERFRAFDSFCKNQSQKLAAEAAARLRVAAGKIEALQPFQPEYAKIEADLAGATPEQKALLDSFVKSADETLKVLKDALGKNAWTQPQALAPSPETALAEMATSLDQRALMEESADKPEERAKLTAEHQELTAREWLVGAKNDVLVQIARFLHIAILETCKKDTATRGITEKNSDLTKQIVTDAFCKRFEIEVKALGLRTIAVKMEEIKGKKGATSFGLRLVGGADHSIHEVASEGEQRCIALAAFLSELSQASHQSALLFDDPVSSLDHWHREKIAARLVQESKVRQVIVLTHETTFVHDLHTFAEKEGVPATFCHVEWDGAVPGQCRQGLPWDHLNPEERLKQLDAVLTELSSSWSPQPTEANRSAMRMAYSKLRATIERVVEHVVLAGVIFRFRRQIKVTSVTEVVGLSEAECDEVIRLYQRCHDMIDAHDSPSAQHPAPPEPADLRTDITETKQFIESVRQRRKAAAAAKKVTAVATGAAKATGII